MDGTSHEMGWEESCRSQVVRASYKSHCLDPWCFCLSLLLLNVLLGEVKALGPVLCLDEDVEEEAVLPKAITVVTGRIKRNSQEEEAASQ